MNILKLEDMQRMSIDEIIDKYSNGYRLGPSQMSLNIEGIQTCIQTLATCLSTIQQGTTKNIVATLTTPGTPGYVYKLYIDNVLIETYPTTGTTNDTSRTFSHIFNESPGSHTYKTELIDSCTSPGPKTVSDSCPVTITTVACPTPVVFTACPTSPITQGSTANIVSSVTTSGTSPYIYKLYVDNVLTEKYPTTGTTPDTSHTFPHVFSETIGDHTYATEITDSCTTPGPVTSNRSQCSVTISSPACPIPTISTVCPTSPITQGSAGNIVATITSPGTPGYTYKLYRDAETAPIDTSSSISNTSYTFSHIFDEPIGSHTYRVEATDSCSTASGGPLTASSSCTVSIQTGVVAAGASPVMIFLIGGLVVGALYVASKESGT